MQLENVTLKRSLGLWAIVGLGLGYMTPTVVFDTFGIVSDETNGVVPMAYLAALIVMLFTAISYGKMVRVFPSAGSAYTYTRETMNPYLGFMVGWTALLDYLLLPMVNALIIRLYMESFFPNLPAWIWVVSYVAIVTILNVWSMGKTSNANATLVIFSLFLIVTFIVLASIKLTNGMGQGTIFTLTPLYHSNVQLGAVLAGATVVCFSFIGFDAITMYAEEAVDEKTLPRAIIFTVLIGGAIFLVSSFFAQALFPNLANFKVTDNTLPEIGLFVGGTIFKIFLVAGGFAATAASGLASHASVSRLLYVMGRNGVLPKKAFGYVHPKFRTPAFNVILVGIVSLLAITPSLELIASVINFGALIAFTFVNLSVLAHFVFHQKKYKTGKDFFNYVIMPLLGAGTTGILWYHLSADALIGGIIWVIIGLTYMVIQLKIFKTNIAKVNFEETDQTSSLT